MIFLQFMFFGLLGSCSLGFVYTLVWGLTHRHDCYGDPFGPKRHRRCCASGCGGCHE